jgi:hypothetical protein
VGVVIVQALPRLAIPIIVAVVVRREHGSWPSLADLIDPRWLRLVATHVAFSTLALVATLVGMRHFCPLVVDDTGIMFGPLLRLRWDEVKSARVRNWLGVPHLHIARHRGFAWWLAMNYAGPRPLLDTVRDRAPADSPLRNLGGRDSGSR